MILKVRGYIFSRSFMGERVPQHVQNLVIRDYCNRHNLHYLLSATEYAMKGCHLMLEQVLNELPELDGVVAYSLFQLPEETSARQRLYDKVIQLNKQFHFAVEGLQMNDCQECDRIETLWRVRQTLPFCQTF
ncbi:MAG: LIC12192 family sporadic carbohydrate cluster protein [Synechococcales cyanobacterium]|nr:sporadic carbohydrate cluster protein, LIC12192 family [Cyanobacteria bacterium REEB444]